MARRADRRRWARSRRVLILDGLHYLNFTAAKFNHDVIQLPFWALAGYALRRAMRGGWLIDWVVLGRGGRRGAVGEVFRRRAGGAAGAVRADRPTTRASPRDARPLCRGAGRAA